MFKNSDSESDIEVVHMHSGKVFREFHLTNMFKKNYGDKGFYSGEEIDLKDEENSESTRTEEPRPEEPETSRTAPTIEVSTIIILVTSVALSN
jgi:hypothetical protein